MIQILISTLFTFFGLLFSLLMPCLSQRFGRFTLWPSSGSWNVTLFEDITGFNQRLYPLCQVYLKIYAYEFLAIINRMSLATIFFFAILLLSMHFFTRAHIATLLLFLLFPGTPYHWFPYYINFYAWSAQEIFVALHMC